mmetsp:Transcript_140775/g.262700  ORF Transcript_140775/g.262700 Transcript_140775/m.262700 type:complete len:104 (-) Transcript_140775:21-332(-)
MSVPEISVGSTSETLIGLAPPKDEGGAVVDASLSSPENMIGLAGAKDPPKDMGAVTAGSVASSVTASTALNGLGLAIPKDMVDTTNELRRQTTARTDRAAGDF